MHSTTFQNVYDQVFDVIVFGGGYGGFAAAMTLHRQRQAVLLVERQAALLWESGWAFVGDPADVGTSIQPLWQELVGRLSGTGGAADGAVDGALAEVLATQWLASDGPAALYYVTPVRAMMDGDDVTAVVVAGKAGLRTLRSRKWIDATETGELRQLLPGGAAPQSPEAKIISLYYRHTQWADARIETVPCPQLPGAQLQWRPTMWSNQRALRVQVPGGMSGSWSAWAPAMRALREGREAELAGAMLTHGSVMPLPVYGARRDVSVAARNVVCVNPAFMGKIRTLADRFEAGVGAAKSAADCPAGPTRGGDEFSPAVTPATTITTAVGVAGLGTGGAIAALAAARAGASVMAFDPLPFVGGIGSGGGIHWYYFGVKGGLQEEVDERIRQIMPLFGSIAQVHGFHPDAKKVVLDQMLDEAGVRRMHGATLWGVHREGQRVASALVATPSRPVAIAASAWIDATGDGDLAAHGGAHYSFGRNVDGMFHAYSQSSGRAGVQDGKARMWVVNFDAGFVDPTDEQDLTRARLVGIGQYAQRRYTETERPTYIAPAIGLRQCRHIECDLMLSLDDHIERRTFADVVGYTGCHYDNHAADYEFESDDAMFWVWACEAWRARIACQIPYRMILPCGLENVLIACRAAGVTEEAHHSFRMQRDFQRLGEVAGYAAAMAAHGGVGVRQVPYAELRAKLVRTGAIEPAGALDAAADTFGPRTELAGLAAEASDLAQWLAEMDKGPGAAMWKLMRRPELARAAVIERLASLQPGISWRAAAVAAMWGEATAEPRLCMAIENREVVDHGPGRDNEQNLRTPPWWFVAVGLLRLCGTGRCLKTLWALAQQADLPLNVRTSIALTCQRIAERHKLSADEKSQIDSILRKVLDGPMPNAVRGLRQALHLPGTPSAPAEDPAARPPVIEDFTWQLHLAAAKAEEAIGLPHHPQAAAFLADPRATVRRAFARLKQRF